MTRSLIAGFLVLFTLGGCVPSGELSSPPQSAEASITIEPTPTFKPTDDPTSIDEPAPSDEQQHDVIFEYSFTMPTKLDASGEINTQFHGETRWVFEPSDDYGAVMPYLGGYLDIDYYYIIDGPRSLYGFCTADGRVICEPVYDSIVRATVCGNEYWRTRRQRDGVMYTVCVALDGSWYFEFEELCTETSDITLDNEGHWDGVTIAGTADYTLATCKIGGKWGAFDGTGILPVPAIYDWKLEYNEGLAAVYDSTSRTYSYIDLKGDMVLGPFNLPTAQTMDADLPLGERNDLDDYEEWGFRINDMNLYFSDDLARFFDGTKSGYIDRVGNEIIPAKYWFGTPFMNGLARGIENRDDEMVKIINKRGEVVYELSRVRDQYGNTYEPRSIPIQSVENGNNAIYFLYNDDAPSVVLSSDGELLADYFDQDTLSVPWKPEVFDLGNGWTTDSSGSLRHNGVYVNLAPDGPYRYKALTSNIIVCYKWNNWHLRSLDGTVIGEHYDGPFTRLNNGMILSNTEGGWGIVGADGELAGERHQGTAANMGGFLIVNNHKGSYTLCDYSGKLLREENFTRFEYDENTGYYFVSTSGYIGLMSPELEWVVKRRPVLNFD